jgi:hypothetical protein
LRAIGNDTPGDRSGIAVVGTRASDRIDPSVPRKIDVASSACATSTPEKIGTATAATAVGTPLVLAAVARAQKPKLIGHSLEVRWIGACIEDASSIHHLPTFQLFA